MADEYGLADAAGRMSRVLSERLGESFTVRAERGWSNPDHGGDGEYHVALSVRDLANPARPEYGIMRDDRGLTQEEESRLAEVLALAILDGRGAA